MTVNGTDTPTLLDSAKSGGAQTYIFQNIPSGNQPVLVTAVSGDHTHVNLDEFEAKLRRAAA